MSGIHLCGNKNCVEYQHFSRCYIKVIKLQYCTIKKEEKKSCKYAAYF